MVRDMKTEAPNFSRNYPLAGDRIGPAWRELWSRLSESRWDAGVDLAAGLSERYDVTRPTVLGLLSKARAAGILDVEYRPHRSRVAAFYRVKQSVAITTGRA